MVRVGLIGFGLAGQAFHAPVIEGVAGMELACVLERRSSLAQELYPKARIARTMGELLSDETIRLVVVATPNDSHFDLAKQSLLAGRDVVVDKPFTPTMAESEELVRLAAERGRLITVYHDRRYDGDFHTVQKIVKSGALGEVVEFESRFDRFRPEAKPGAWRERADQPGAGVLFDLGPHVIDQALILFGVPQAVTAWAIRQRDTSEVDDAFDVLFEYPRTRALLRARILAFAPTEHFLLHGTRGSFVKYGMDPQEELLRTGKFPTGKDWGPNWGVDREEFWGTLSVDGAPRRQVKTERGDYRNFYANVRDAMEKKARLEVTPEQCLQVMRATLLAHKSSREKRTVRWDEAVE